MGSHSDMYPNMLDTGRDGIYVPCLVNPTSTSIISTSISMPPGYFTASSSYPKLADPTSAAVAAAVDNRALLASQNHREAEKRRRERIKSHLDRLRSILACEPKIDKASLLAKAVEIMRDLKQRISDITSNQLFLIPTETDEIVVLPSTASPAAAAAASTSQRLVVFDASICCDDRSDLLPDLIETLRSLRIKILRAEMATMGGRMRNQLLLAREDDEETDDPITGGEFLRDALKSLVDRPSPVERSKRRRVAEMT